MKWETEVIASTRNMIIKSKKSYSDNLQNKPVLHFLLIA